MDASKFEKVLEEVMDGDDAEGEDPFKMTPGALKHLDEDNVAALEAELGEPLELFGEKVADKIEETEGRLSLDEAWLEVYAAAQDAKEKLLKEPEAKRARKS